MKNLVLIFIFVLCLTGIILAQDAPEGNIMVVTTMETKDNPDGSVAEFDSLNQLYTDNVIKKNNLIISSKSVQNFWGHNNRDYLVMYEVKSWEDVHKANVKNNELFEKAWSTEEERKTYNDAWNKYFTGKHSDEIYRELETGRK